MPEGRQGPDDPENPETLRRFPVEPDAKKSDSRAGADSNSPETFSTEIQTRSKRNRDLAIDPFSTEIENRASVRGSDSGSHSGSDSGSHTGSESGSGSAGSFVERGVVEVHEGQLVFGKYLVLERLGEGGMGEVWLVKDVELDVKRALKMITKGTAFDATARARFRREARAMARFTHPNVVAVHDSRLDQRDVAYIVMEYVAGQSLEKILRPGEPMPLDWTLHVLTQLCEALQEAHDQGIVHRDLKPSNLILVTTSTGRKLLKVLDFGIAKILRVEGAAADAQTMLGDFMGTPPYASPEQATGRCEPWSDLYSVGVLLYEFLTGYRPFRGKAAVVIANTMLTPPPTFAESNPSVKIPPAIERVVMHCLAKNPSDRPQSALALLDEFRAALLTGEEKVEPPPPRRIPRPTRRHFLIAGSVLATALGLGFAAPRLLKTGPIADPVPNKSESLGPSSESNSIEPRIDRDGRTFRLWRGRVYLPEGYSAADPSDIDETGYPSTLVRRDGRRFVRIPGGQFLMGGRGEEDIDATNRPAHLVVVPAFYMQEHEITNEELLAYFKRYQDTFSDPAASESWRTWYHEVSSYLSPELAANHPARQVPWRLAADFARRNNGWLPSEAQWEYAARSGKTARVFVWDLDKERDTPRENQANLFREPKNGVWTTEVGVFLNDQTRQGVMDMTGNVREWCRDPWIPYKTMPTGGPPRLPDNPPLDTQVVVRGGSFLLDYDHRFINRRGNPVRISDEPKDVGFRLVIECPEVRPTTP